MRRVARRETRAFKSPVLEPRPKRRSRVLRIKNGLHVRARVRGLAVPINVGTRDARENLPENVTWEEVIPGDEHQFSIPENIPNPDQILALSVLSGKFKLVDEKKEPRELAVGRRRRARRAAV